MRKFSTPVLLVLLLSTNLIFAQIPAGYYTTAESLTGAQLKTALYKIISTHTAVSYTPGVWNAFYTTDVKPNGKVWDIYSDVPSGTLPYEYTLGSNQCGSYSGEGDCYNREHSFPKSWFGDVAPMNVDIFHLYPTDGYVNGHRSNYPYGPVSSPTWTSKNGSKLGPCSAPGYTGIVFEPIDDYKGDLARGYFYMVTCYENLIVGWYSNAEAKPTLNATTFPAFNPWILSVLLAWNAADPVSQKEIDRNNAIYAIQHNRNPYIDHPEYVNAVWGSNTVLAEPSNHVLSFAVSSTTTTTISLTWSDNDGTQPAGKFLILANTTGTFNSPSDGTALADDLVLSDNSGTVNVSHGAQTYTWTGLTPGTTYYFEIFPYTNTGTDVNYKIDGTVPAANGKTLVPTILSAAPLALSGFSYTNGSGPSTSKSFSVSGSGLVPTSGNISITGSTNYEISTDNSLFGSSQNIAYSSGTLSSTTVYTRLKSGLVTGNYNSELLSISGGSATAVKVTCSGSVIAPPALNTSATTLSGFSYSIGNGPSASKSYSISGTALLPVAGNITVSGSGNYEVSTNNNTFSSSVNLAYTGGVLSSKTVYARLKAGLGAGDYSSELISNVGGNATAINVTCSGSVIQPALLTVAPDALTGFSYDLGGGPSNSQSYDLSGIGLIPESGNITITSSTDFEISINNSTFTNLLDIPYSGGELQVTPIYVQLKSDLSTGTYDSETISMTGGGAASSNVTCSGVVTNFTGISINSNSSKGIAFYYHGLVNISVPGMEGKEAQVVLYSVTGKQLYASKVIMQNKVTVIASLLPGIYFVKVQTGKEFYSTKLVVGEK
jgi:endonuclease I